MEGKECEHCKAIKPRWMGAAHTCMPPTTMYHPYNYFFDPITGDCDD